MNEGNFSKNNGEKSPQAAGPGRKKALWVVVGAFSAIFILVAGFIAWRAFDTWRGQKGVELLSESFKRAAEEKYERQMADTYGGETPQETLRMYIEAVEAGDYELASKYFVIEKQNEELRSFDNALPEDLTVLLEVLRRVRERSKEELFRIEYENFVNVFDKKDMTFEEYVKLFELEEKYSRRKDAAMITDVDGYLFSVDFVLYPNGIWKIEEI